MMSIRCLLVFFLLSLSACATLPSNTDRLVSHTFLDTGDTRLGKGYQKLSQGKVEESAFVLLGNGLDAFTARKVLAMAADRSIDAQYYMIHNDMTGLLFIDELLMAADRGVRVRLLIDDIDLQGRDHGLALLASHPHIYLRVFNPFSRSALRAPQYLTRFGAVTRRMHNKSFTVDNQATVVGGRNIGDEYFEANPELAFADLDLLAFGKVVKEVSQSFDAYWNSEFAFPIATLRPDLVAEYTLEEARLHLRKYLAEDQVLAYKDFLYDSDFAIRLRENTIAYNKGRAKALYDLPDKLSSYDQDEVYSLSYQMGLYFVGLHKELLIFSPYFVPGKEGTDFLCSLSNKGVRVRILTNSLASTDVSLVHAGYAKYRRRLLRNGVELYEMNKKLSKKTREKKKSFHGSSKASLHAKSFVIDRDQVFVGSLNFDPRSVTENTEIGIMVYSKETADTMAEVFDLVSSKEAFRLQLKKDNQGVEHIHWHGQENGTPRVWTVDPYTGFWKRFGIFFMGLLPIESQL